MDLGMLVTDIETEGGGTIRGIDLGSILDHQRGQDASDYRIGLAALVEADPAWREECHAMASNGSWARRYYAGVAVAERRGVGPAEDDR